MDRDKRILIFSGLTAFLVLIIGSLWLSRTDPDPYKICRKGMGSNAPKIADWSFALTSHKGEGIISEKIFEKPTLIYFGYTSCPDICPMDSARNAEAVSILEGAGFEVTPVFVSVDPKRDTPEILAEYVQAMHPRMIGLTGTAQEIDVLTNSWGSSYRIDNPDDQENYPVEHTTYTYLVLPDAGPVEIFERNIPSDEVSRRTACFLTTNR